MLNVVVISVIMLNITVLIVIMLNATMMNAIKLNVVAPSHDNRLICAIIGFIYYKAFYGCNFYCITVIYCLSLPAISTLV